ncbi:MAG TPA: histidinol-phosphate transaminase, partial [Caulifigura sp.]|nr:histidinol-phosphate transaminase [Caulifigura sp.]
PDRPNPGPDLLLGIGSTEILHAAAWEYSSEPGNIVEPHPSYSVLGTIAARRPDSRIDRRMIPLDAGHRIDLDAMRKAVDADTRFVMICNPNNPTGTTVSRKAIESFITDVPTSALVFVDEAYIEFLPEYEQRSVVAAAMSRPNVLVARTFSKVYGMAGLRVGYAIASGEVIWRLKRHMQGELSPNVPGMAAALAALEDPQHVQTTVALNNRIQKRFRDELPPLGFKYIPSEACFTWIEAGDDAGKLVRFLFDRGVIIVHGQRWDMPTCIRVSVGTDAEMDRFFAALREYRAAQA